MSKGKRKMKEKVDKEKALTFVERRERLITRFEKSAEDLEALEASAVDSVTLPITLPDLKVLLKVLTEMPQRSKELDDRFIEWRCAHNKECPYARPESQGAIGGRLTFSYTYTGLGPISTVECACGEKKDLTDYDAW